MFVAVIVDEDEAHLLERAISSVATARSSGTKNSSVGPNRRMSRSPNLTETLQEDNHLFMAHSSTDAVLNDVWFIDSGCSNHMSGTRSLFEEIDQSQKSDVNLPNGASIRIGGRGTISVNTSDGNIQHNHDVQYVPSLAYNLLSECWLVDGEWILCLI